MKIITCQQNELFKSFIESHNSFIVVGHKDPDGDCISSCIGVSYILEHYKKEYIMLNAGPFKRVEIKEYEKLFLKELPFMSEDDRKSTGLIIVDCSELHRTGEVGDLKGFDTFIVDHHKTADCPPEYKTIIDPSSPAACSLIQMLYENICGPLDARKADNFLFGLSTDTGFFRFLREDSAEVFELTARLVRAGANPNQMYNRITGGKAYSTRKLLGIMLNRAERYCNGKLVITYETMEDTKKYGQEGRDSDLLYQALLSCEGVEAAVFLRQETENSCTGGFRSQDKIDVSVVAGKFGGGGHKNASGMSTDGKVETLIPAIVKEFSKIL